MENKQDIGKLFSSKLKNYQVSGSEVDWQGISTKLGWANFVKFSLVTFNIYYLSAILIFAGVATYSGIKNFVLIDRIQKLEKAVEVYNKTNVLPAIKESIDSSDITSPKAPDPIQSSTFPIVSKKDQKPSFRDKQDKKKMSITDSLPVAKIDTVKVASLHVVLTDSVKPGKRIKKIKKTIYIKPSDIVKRDTVIISKQKK